METLSVAAVVVLLGLAVAPSEAQWDFGKVLVGRWEGELQRPKAPGIYRPHALQPSREHPGEGRTLVIQDVREEGTKWIVTRAQFGITGKPLGGVDVTLDLTGTDVTLHFTTGAGAQAELKLTGENALVGTLALARTGFTPMELKKVE
jgi:hypothetical protein